MQSLVEWTPLSYSRDLEVKPKKIVGNIVCLILLFILVFWGKKDKDVLVNLSPTHWWGTAVVVKRIHKFQWSLIVWHLFLLLRRKSIQFLFLHFFLLRYPLSLADEELCSKNVLGGLACVICPNVLDFFWILDYVVWTCGKQNRQ